MYTQPRAHRMQSGYRRKVPAEIKVRRLESIRTDRIYTHEEKIRRNDKIRKIIIFTFTY